jgi:hypothetical protein
MCVERFCWSSCADDVEYLYISNAMNAAFCFASWFDRESLEGALGAWTTILSCFGLSLSLISILPLLSFLPILYWAAIGFLNHNVPR